MKAAGKRYIMYGSRSDQIRIWNMSDLHIGNKGCSMSEVRRDVKEIADDPYSFWLGGGDYAEFIGYTDKRFDPDSVSENIGVKDLGQLGHKLMGQVRDVLLPIKDKCLGLLYGNHEDKYQKWTQQQHLHSWLCVELGVPNLGYSAVFDVSFVRISGHKRPKLLFNSKGKTGAVWTVRFFVHHGAGYAQTKGGKINRLSAFMDSFQADVFMVGHVHDQMGIRRIRIGADSPCTKLTQHEMIGVISGSYLKTYSDECVTYGEQRGYSPTVLGPAIVTFTPDKCKFEGTI